ncbi:hypothetical protein AAF712_016825, partial [Marasmius tenuissimus]
MINHNLDCKLPFELVELVLDNCDRSELFTCSLVCHPWLLSSRPRLFKRLEIDRPCDGLVSLLGSRYCTIAVHLEELVFRLDIYGWTGEDEHIRLDLIQPIVACLEHKVPSMRKLTIIAEGSQLLRDMTETKMGTPKTTLGSYILRSFGHVTELDLQLYVEDPTALIQFISSFSHLQVLTIHSGCFDPDEDEDRVIYSVPPTSFRLLPPSVKSLQITGQDDGRRLMSDGLPHSYRWLNVQNPQNLAWFSVFRAKVDESLDPGIQSFLARCRELKFLNLGFDT